MPAYNLNALFNTVAYEDDLLRNITLNASNQQEFRDARDIIRESLRSGLPRLLRDGWIDDEPAPRPRFVTQGSWAYRTLNAPCRHPQQADLDYGVYLPVGYVDGYPPTAGARLYFEAVEAVLEPVAKENSWELNDENGNCVRLVIAKDKHIDVPCYVMRREDFEQQQRSMSVRLAEELQRLPEDVWRLELIPPHGVLRATRSNGWSPDDPRPLFDWWKSAISAQGEQLRRVVRYLKAARDYEAWPNDEEPKSLLLTAAAEKLFERRDRRDDRAIAETCRSIEKHLRGGGSIENPVKRTQDLAQALDERHIRGLTCDWLGRIAQAIEYATARASEPRDAVEKVRPQFGSRLPNDPARVAQDTVATATPARSVEPALAGTVHSG